MANPLRFNRLDIADAFVAYGRHNKAMRDRFHATRSKGAALSNLGTYGYGSVWDTISSLEPSAVPHYFALVAKLEGSEKASALEADWCRIADPAGVTIYLETSEEDPFQTTAHIHDPIASAWCDAHGALDGGTWEECDGPEFCYDLLYWHPGQIEALEKEGYVFDFSQYSEPDESDLAIAKHGSECSKCNGDFLQAREHLERSAS